MRKIINLLAFLVMFVYFYKNSRKFRVGFLSSLVAAGLGILSPPPAHSEGNVDAFTQPNQPHTSRIQKRKGIFSHKSNNPESGTGKPNLNDGGSGGDDDDLSGDELSQFPETESVQKTKERVENIETLTRRMEESSDSESETEDECPNPNLQEKDTKKKKKNPRAVPRERAVQAYQEFLSEMKEKGYDKVDISEDRFLELAINPETEYFEEKSIIEAKGGLEAELKGMFQKLRRPDNPNNKLDFQAKLPDGTTVFVDHKQMIDFNRLAEEKGIEVGHFPSHETVAFKMGKDSVEQKGKHIPKHREGTPICIPGFPCSESDVIHLFNLKHMTDPAEIPGLKQSILNGAEAAGHTGTDGMLFLIDIGLKEF